MLERKGVVVAQGPRRTCAARHMRASPPGQGEKGSHLSKHQGTNLCYGWGLRLAVSELGIKKETRLNTFYFYLPQVMDWVVWRERS